ncbi:hypothetical protein LPJ53_002288 [Coemansia erecta]|uniref:PH domain-containing protein n=1 Tax=Coemansia erecta TaxID=147472 RepID=A0A9W8CT59_9FUNG|nr:hypothetical protein LPJ53_002288 [Coemansia erecta]
MATAVEDSWIVVDKTSDGSLRAKASHESLYLSDDDEPACKPRVHVKAKRSDDALAPELLEWISNAANESSTALPLANRNSSVSKCSYRTNSSSAGSKQRRTPRRSSVHATSEVSSLLNRNSLGQGLDGIDMFNEGLFVVKVLEVKQVGATKPMNLQCVANVGEERFVIPPVLSKPKNYNTWSSKMDDTFVFDVSRQFTFNLGVYGTHPHQPRRNTAATVASRVSMASRRHLGRSMLNDSNPSLLSNGSTRTTAKIKRGFRKIFRNKNGGEEADDPAYAGTPPATPMGSARNSMMGMPGSSTSVGEDARHMVDNDLVQTEETTDEMGRSIEVQKHTPSMAGSIAELTALHGASSSSLNPSLDGPQHGHLQHPALARLSTYLPRGRTSTTTSAHEINYNGPRLRAFSNASTISSTPQPLGELYLDFKVDRREKRRATFTLPVVNQDQVAMRGGSHVEMAVVLEYGIIVHETFEERAARQRSELQREEADRQVLAQQQAERQWAEVDEQDRLPRLRGYLSVFTRSGRLSTWKRYWAVLSCARVLFYESEADEAKGVQPVAKISLVHLLDAGIPQSDLINIGPTGIELRLSPLSMTDRHRRKSAFPRKSAGEDMGHKMRKDARAFADHMPDLRSLRISHTSSESIDRTLTSAPAGLNQADEEKAEEEEDEDDATLHKYSDWQCRVYLLLETLGDRDQWLHELTHITVPSAEFARMRAKQRALWRRAQFESATESLRQSGKALQVVAAQALDKKSEAHNAQAKKAFADSVGQRVVSTAAVASKSDDLAGDTLTSSGAFEFGIPNASAPAIKKAAVAMAFGKPATFSLSIVPTTTINVQGHASQLPAKKKLRARRKSNSMANLRQSFDTSATLAGSSDDENVAPKAAGLSIYSAAGRKPNFTATPRCDSSGSTTMVEVVGTAAERRPGTVSRRFLFVWNVNDI